LQRIVPAQHHLFKPYNHPSSAQPVLDKKQHVVQRIGKLHPEAPAYARQLTGLSPANRSRLLRHKSVCPAAIPRLLRPPRFALPPAHATPPCPLLHSGPDIILQASAQPGPVACSYAVASTEPTYGATTAFSSSRARKPQKSPGGPSIAALPRSTANMFKAVATRLPIKFWLFWLLEGGFHPRRADLAYC
jgi:hypothetical protein